MIASSVTVPAAALPWTQQDINDEIFSAALCEETVRSAEAVNDETARAVRAVAERHRLRAEKIAALLEHTHVAAGWYPARLLLDPIPSTTAVADGGPFAGQRMHVRNPPRPMWVAATAAGGPVVCYVVPGAPLPVPPPAGALLGHYACDGKARRLAWHPLARHS